MDEMVRQLNELNDARNSADELIKNVEGAIFSKFDSLTPEQKDELNAAITLLRNATGDTSIDNINNNIKLLQDLFAKI